MEKSQFDKDNEYCEFFDFTRNFFNVRWFFQDNSYKDVEVEYRSQHWYEENYKLTCIDDIIAQLIYGWPFYETYILDIEQKYKDKLTHWFKKNPKTKFVYSRGNRGILVLFKGKLNKSYYHLQKWFTKRKIRIEFYNINHKYII